ncbi:MAG TPA: cation diffusion facilitator family transporter [Candidatus Thiothrix moscowensis]|uniref:cation diffusion facilitator family transporter n=1 Tax=unclassified Thiothrix TaxID=2636184 RepID=UPI0025F659E4|nr:MULTISPECIES: cation diffusion facilitator family transporter [unclassified Thiothrix]HRJ51251.1 cation diffusion facilitator family transporter [Candidatus Thiothrix moscowensis]HRJ91694.1 cation diffusion facilitator family transporter [Candidatus Thiothrix moscowensis]
MSGHQHHLHDAPDSGESRQSVTRRVALVGMSVNIFLVIAQVIGGIITASQALIADAMHTLSDLVGDIVVLVAAHHAGKAADANHPYGHGRIETLATVILGLLLSGVAVVILMQAWERLFGGEPLVTPDAWAMAFALLAIIGKEGLYHYTVHVAKRIHSPMLKASAWHHRSDAISSVLVLLAIAGAQLGFAWLDAAAAMIVAAMIFYMAIQLILESTSELVDTGLEPQEVQDIHDFICAINGVENVHLLRTRRMGGRVLADVHLQVDGRISVSEGHHIGETVMYRLRKQFPSISDVVVHIDPEDDETAHPCKNLPSRAELREKLQAIPSTAPFWSYVNDLTLHYIDGKISIDLILNGIPTQETLADFEHACKTVGCIERVVFLTRIASK